MQFLQSCRQFRQFAVTELCSFFVVIRALRDLDLAVYSVDLLFDGVDGVDAGFFRFQTNFQFVELVAQFRKFGTDGGESFQREFVRFFFERGLLDLKLDDLTVYFVHFYGHRTDLRLDDRTCFVYEVDRLVG